MDHARVARRIVIDVAMARVNLSGLSAELLLRAIMGIRTRLS
jgi:hypothetical protein